MSTQSPANLYAGTADKWPDGTPVRLVMRPVGDSDTEFIKAMSPDIRVAKDAAEWRPGMLFTITDQETADSIEKMLGSLGPTTSALVLSEKRALRVETADEHSVVLDSDGQVLAESSHVLQAPVLVREVTLFDAGQPVGLVRVQHSWRNLLLQAAGVGLAGLPMAPMVLIVWRQWVRRTRRILAAMYEQQERARVTLHSIGDGAITIDASQNIDDMNPAAERLAQWTLADVRGQPLDTVCFEITETAAINNMRHATEFMRMVKALGCSFALDDFGIGTGSRAYLKTLPVDYLKIDGSFIRNIVTDPINRTVADTINRVGHIMGLQTVGEYAESEAVIDALRKFGIDFAQGDGVQRPQPLPGPWPAPPARGAAPVASDLHD